MSNVRVPLVSVITVVRNGAATIASTLESVRNQRQVDVEHIIIDGASTDDTVDIIKAYQCDQLCWVSEPDQGIYDAMNKGISLAQGEWLLFLGADDILSNSTVLDDIFLGRELMGYDLICGQSLYRSGKCCKPRLDWRTLIFNTIHHQAAFYRRSLFDKYQFRNDIPVMADYEMNFLLYLRRKSVLNVDRNISICGSQGVSFRSSQIVAQVDMFKIRSRYINVLKNAIFFSIGLINLALTSILRRTTKHK